jgi:DNA-binding NtrC family response regulator
MIENAMHYIEGDTLKLSDFKMLFDNNRINIEALDAAVRPIEAVTRDAERKLITEMLMRFGGNKTKTAAYLKISRTLLYQKMQRLDINYKLIPTDLSLYKDSVVM